MTTFAQRLRRAMDQAGLNMGRPLSWAPGLPLRAAGFEAGFYMKD